MLIGMILVLVIMFVAALVLVNIKPDAKLSENEKKGVAISVIVVRKVLEIAKYILLLLLIGLLGTLLIALI